VWFFLGVQEDRVFQIGGGWMTEDILTANMKKALIQVGFGVRKYHDGRYRQIDDTSKTVDTRSLDALHKRGLLFWRGQGGATHQIHLELTESGEEIFEEINA